MGLLKIQAGYGNLYRIPICDPEVDIGSSTKTLLQLVENNKRFQPLLSDKLRLASVLAQFLGDFQSVGWLHKNFHSDNILFFNIKSSELDHSPILATQILEQPYIVGFQESRLGGNTWHTAGSTGSANFEDYQRPEYARTGRYRAAYDYYTLGLILLELGLWQPLRGPRFSTTTLPEFRQKLLQTREPFLGPMVGALYRDVVHFCLSGTMESSEDLNINVLEAFAKNVIEPLRKLAALDL